MILSDREFERFVAKVSMGDGCWPWLGKPNRGGYGRFRFEDRRQLGAHVVSLSFFVESPPFQGAQALHVCDNPICVRPGHLYWGTNVDNMRDRSDRGRTARQIGEDNPRAKLTEAQVREIRSLYAAGGVTQRELADLYGVSQTLISYITLEKHWKHTCES